MKMSSRTFLPWVRLQTFGEVLKAVGIRSYNDCMFTFVCTTLIRFN